MSQDTTLPLHEQERANFEAAAISFGWPPTAPGAYWRSVEQDYSSNMLSSGWQFWQARAAIAAQAPQPFKVVKSFADSVLSMLDERIKTAAQASHPFNDKFGDHPETLVAAKAQESELKEVRWQVRSLGDRALIDLMKFSRPQEAQQAQGVPREWRSALRKVVFMARTSGGTTGPDSGLMAVLSEAEALLSRPYLLAAAPQAEPQPDKLAISPIEEQQMFNDWCPYKGSPDPRIVWAAAISAANGFLAWIGKKERK